MERSDIARAFLADAFPPPLQVVEIHDLETFEKLAEIRKGAVYHDCGFTTPIPNVQAKMVLIGFYLPPILEITYTYSDLEFVNFLHYWQVRLTIRLAKEAELLKMCNTYDDLDHLLVEDLVDSEMSSIYSQGTTTS